MLESPFDVLGLSADASLVEIKKAYARLLKTARPDEDLEAFQRIEEAYARCIELARAQQQATVRAALAQPAVPVADGGSASAGETTTEPGYLQPRMRPPAGLQPVALDSLLQSIAEAASRLGSEEFEDWLEDNAALLPLDVQVQVARALPDFIIANPLSFDPFYIVLLYDYLAGTGGSAISFGDPGLQRAWEQAHASTSFAEDLANFRQGGFTVIERLALAELLDPPDPRRRRFLERYPFARADVEAMFGALCSLDPERGPAAVRAEARARWLPARGGSRPMQHIEPVVWVLGSASALWLGLGAIAPNPPRTHPGLAALMFVTLALAAALLAGRLYASALARPRRKERTRPPPGPDALGLWTCLLCVPLVASCLAQATWPASGFVAAPFAIIVGALLAVLHTMAGRFRAEAAVLYIALVYVFMRALWPLGRGIDVAEDAYVGMSFVVAAVGVWLVDRAHAHWARLTVQEARKQFSLPVLMFAMLAWVLAYFA